MTPSTMNAELATVQRWMLSVITHPDGVVEGARSAEAQQQMAVAPDKLEQVIERSSKLTSRERLGVYANAYFARLIECLEDEFPAMGYVLGEDTFRAFAMEYLQRYPPGSYTLAELAANFPRFLRETRPVEESHGNDAAHWTDFLIDLATLERTYTEVFDGPGAEERTVLQPEALAAIPPERWPDATLLPAGCLRLLKLRFPVHEFAAAVKRDQESVMPPPSTTYLVVSRRNYVVRPRAVTQLEFEILQGLCEGQSVGEVITLATESSDASFEELAIQLRDWFGRWSADGLFIEVTIPD